MSLFRTSRLVPVFAALSAVALLAAPRLVAETQETKSFFLTVLDAKGQPVTDLRTEEVMVRELADGAEPMGRQVVNVRRAPQPANIMLLADTSKATGGAGMAQRGKVSGSELVRDVRMAFSAFVKTMAASNPETEMELMEFGQAAVTVTPMTSDVAKLEKGIATLFPKNDMPAVLMEAITEAARTLAKAKSPRRAIVAMNVLPTDEQGRVQPRQMGEALINSNASFWAVSYNSGTVTQDPRGVLLEPLAKNTGGRREVIASQSALEMYMTNIANALANQYEVSFTRQSGGATPKIIQVGVTRQGLSLHASIYPPK